MERSKGTEDLNFQGRLLGVCSSFPLRCVVRPSPGFHHQGSAGRGLLGSSALGSVPRTKAEPSRYGRVGVITVLGQLPLFSNFATFGCPSAARGNGSGERELERKQPHPHPRHFQSSTQAVNRGIFQPGSKHKARRDGHSLTSALGGRSPPTGEKQVVGLSPRVPWPEPPISCLTHPPGFQSGEGNVLAPCNHHHLVSSLHRRTAGPRVRPGSRRPPCSRYSVAAAPGAPGRGGGTGRSSGREQAGTRRRRRFRGPADPGCRRPRSRAPSRARLGATARARPLAGARGGPGPPAAASGD